MKQFEEIAHSGGKIQIVAHVSPDGQRSVQFGYTLSRPVPSTLIAVWAIYPGIVVEDCPLGGIGTPWPTPRYPDSIPVLIASDSEGQFGHFCPNCSNYWRSGPHPNNCPYCGISAESFHFLSKAQLEFVQHYCSKWVKAGLLEDGESLEIDLDEIADATLGEAPKPDFYISEERQQNSVRCSACGHLQEILGRFCYCSVCSTRNDYTVISEHVLPAIREELKSGRSPHKCLQEAVSAFETLVKQYSVQLREHVPMTPQRRDKISKPNFRDWNSLNSAFSELFGIDLKAEFSQEAWSFCHKLVLRRHVYEHNGGVVDQSYLDRSRDDSVKLGQEISEIVSDLHEFLSHVNRMSKVIHDGFHSIFPPDVRAITAYQSRKKKPD